MKNIILIVIATFIFANIIIAQKSKIFGIVSSKGKTLSNVSIYLNGNKNQFYTDKNGKYEIEVFSNANLKLMFTHIGYLSVEKNFFIKENENYELNIILEQSLINIGEAVVSSSRYEKLLKETVIPIEFIDNSTIEKTNFLTLSEMVSKNAGISLIKDAPWGTSINIRGLSKQNIIYMVDGYRIETSTNLSAGLSLFNLNDVENIEIVKGGISSLYGSGATGGIINIKSKEPKFDSNFFIQPNFTSSYNSVNNGVSNNLSISTGNQIWSFYLSGLYRTADDIETPNGILKNSSFKDESLNGKIKISPIENIEVNLSYNKFSAYDVGLPGGEPFQETAEAKYIFAKREIINGEIYFYNLSKYSAKTQLKFYHQKIKRNVEVKPNANAVSNPNATHTMNGFTIQNNWIFNESNILITGIDYWQREYEGLRTTTNKKAKIVTVEKPVPDSKFKNFGIFITNEFELIKNEIAITIGGRYDFINIKNDETKNPVYVNNNGTINYNTKNEDASYLAFNENNKSFSGNFGALYKLNKEINFTINAAYTFRSPSIEERYQYIDLGGIKSFGNPNLNPEKGISFDAGLRIWKDNYNLRFNTFLNNLSNLVIDKEIFADSVYRKENIGKAMLYGFDLSTDYKYFKNNSFYGTASFVIGKDLISNNYLPQIPPLNFVLGTQIEVIDEINCDVNMNIFANQDKIANDENRTGGYTVFNFSLNSDEIIFFGSFVRISIGMENIFNRAFRNHLSTFRGINLLEPGRNIFAKINIALK
ncbi:MAG: TonB-dependent receptor [Ignavibacteriae bacterium]|nr:TonB-dependent receptor [Ignavibacteriota bacterium]